ncbi:unnamed protein product [Ascophyllum nodosum]
MSVSSRCRKRGRITKDENHQGCPTTTATDRRGRSDDYSSLAYWDNRYSKGVSWEWYCAFDHIRPLFERFIPKWENSRVLEVGCGDKPLAWDMRAAGHAGRNCSFDCSPTVIGQLVAEKESCDHKRLDDDVDFRVLDAKRLPFEAGSFDLVVDKGTVDALLCDGTGTTNARQASAARVLAHGGWLVVVSHVDPATDEGASLLSEVLVPAMQESTPAGKGNGKNEAFSWSIDVHCSSEDDDEGESGSCCDEGEEHGGFDEGCAAGGEDATSGRGPSVYMARKVATRQTRASGKGQRQQEVAIRIHEY